jgi:broad specificity phosphatase PhoE
MGCNQSVPKTNGEHFHQEGECVIEIVRANNLPNMDIGSLTDAYVIMKLIDGDNNKQIGNEIRTLTRSNSLNPIFHSYHYIPIIPNDHDMLSFVVFDEDIASSDDNIGKIEIPFSSLKVNGNFNKEITFDLNMTIEGRYRSTKDSSGNAIIPTITIRLVSFGPKSTKPLQKKIFVIRHGESKWNESQSGKDIKGMVSQYDHELTQNGIQQAQSFNQKWKNLQSTKNINSEENNKHIETFLSAESIYVSPLTRAIETAMLTCESHPAMGKGITLLRNIREIKNFGSFDTVGKYEGDEIVSNVRKIVQNDIGADFGTAINFNINDAYGPWWTPLEVKENHDDVHARFIDLWNYLHYGTDAEIIILVGHSHFFRHMMKDYMSKEFKSREPAWTKKLESCKLDNGAGMLVTVDWLPNEAEPVISDASLVFGSQLADDNGDVEVDVTGVNPEL